VSIITDTAAPEDIVILLYILNDNCPNLNGADQSSTYVQFIYTPPPYTHLDKSRLIFSIGYFSYSIHGGN